MPLLFLLFPSIPQIETYFLLLTGYILLQRAQIPHPLSSCLLAESSLLPLLVLLFQTDALRYISSVPFSPCLVGILSVPPSSFQNATSPFSLSLHQNQGNKCCRTLQISILLKPSALANCFYDKFDAKNAGSAFFQAKIQPFFVNVLFCLYKDFSFFLSGR